jgi:hypothetical protein
MFVNARIINRKEKKNPSQIIIDTFAVLFSLFTKFPLYVIILFYRLNTVLQKAFIIKILLFKIFHLSNAKWFLEIHFLVYMISLLCDYMLNKNMMFCTGAEPGKIFGVDWTY